MQIRLSSPILPYLFRALDFATICLAGWLSVDLKAIFDQPILAADWSNYTAVVGIGAVLYVISWGSIYRSWRGSSMLNVLKGAYLRWMIVAGLVLFGIFLFKSSPEVSRLWFIIWVVFGLMLLFMEKLAVYQLLRFFGKIGYNHRKVIIVGSGAVESELKDRIRKTDWSGFDIVGSMPGVNIEHLEKLENKDVDEVWLALQNLDENTIKNALYGLRRSAVQIRIVPDMLAFDLINYGYSAILGMPMIDITVSKLSGWNLLQKRALDIFISVVAILILFPIMCILALLIKLESSGPIIFKQERNGASGRRIYVYKFRSMRIHDDGPLIKQATVGDPRLTRIGKWIRKTSLDELPQFFNVLAGSMSVVGPRPHAYSHNEYYKELIDLYMKRHLMKPGITGWAQVNGFRGETDTIEKMEQRVKYDLYYIQKWSILFDLKIIVMTLFHGIYNKNAY